MELNISDRAREYQRSDEDDGTTATAFENGAEWMQAELTRWHDPKEDLPKPNTTVLCKVNGYTESDYLTLTYCDNQWWIFHTESSPFGPVGCSCYFPHEVLAWREIHAKL